MPLEGGLPSVDTIARPSVMLLELAQGGELFTLLRDMDHFAEVRARARG